MALLPAALVTLALFYLMHVMISGRGERVDRVEGYGGVDLVRLERESEDRLRTRPRRPLPQAPQAPPRPPLPPALAALPRVAPVEPDLVVEVAGPASHGLGRPPPLSALASPVQRPVVEPPPKAPQGPTGGPLPAASLAAQAARPTGPEAAVGARDAPPGDIRGVEPGLPGIGGAGDAEVVPLVRLEPVYPRKAARAGKEGWVKVEFTINARGKVTDAVVVDARPRRIFDRSALKAIRKWRFKPMLSNGEAVPRRATQVFEFKLAGM